MDHHFHILDFYVDRVFKKHGVTSDTTELSVEEKERMKEIIENIQTDVQRFVEDVSKPITEENFSNNTSLVSSTISDNEQVKEAMEVFQQQLTDPKIFINQKNEEEE